MRHAQGQTRIAEGYTDDLVSTLHEAIGKRLPRGGGAVVIFVSAMPLCPFRRNVRKRVRCTANPDAAFPRI